MNWNLAVRGGGLDFPPYTYSDSTPGSTAETYTLYGRDEYIYWSPETYGTSGRVRRVVLHVAQGALRGTATNVSVIITPDAGIDQSNECYDCRPYRLWSSGTLVAEQPVG